ncbi:hypothetical protein L0Y59_03415, partial [Candidatus Uhrbacteria bacterium]|nr:hypothetical protein [Candidatus Uhrbacteria bacterium]
EGAAGTQYIDTGTVETFRVMAFGADQISPGLTVAQWVASDTGIPVGSLRVMSTRTGLDAWQTPDGRRTYVDLGGAVLMLAYDSDTSPTIEFRSFYALLIDAITPI